MLLIARHTSENDSGAAAETFCGLGGSPECWRLDKVTRGTSDDTVSAVIARMYELAAAGASSPELSTLAARWRGLPVMVALEGIWQFLAGSVRFISDLDSLAAARWNGDSDAAVELLIPPAELLAMKYPAADCEDFSTAAMALIFAAGLPCSMRLRTIAADPRYPDSWTHVYVMVRVEGEDVAFDASHGRGLGWEAAPGLSPRRGGVVAYVGRKKDWREAYMVVTRSTLNGMKQELARRAGLGSLLDTLLDSPIAASGGKILEARYGNRPQGTFIQYGPNGQAVTESFGAGAYPNNITSGGGTLLVIGLGLFAVVAAAASSRGRS